MSILSILGRGGAIIALILLIVALLNKLILLFGVLLTLIKVAIVVAFVGILVMIALAMFRARRRDKREMDQA